MTLLGLAQSLAREAGEVIRWQRPARVQVAATKSSPTDVVTEMDAAVEALLRRRLAGERPQDAVLGEEDGLSGGGSGLTWVVDPIDGTVNYLYGIPAYAVSVAVVEGDPRVEGAWRPVAGCVHNAATGETWTAAVGEGAWLDGAPLRPVEVPELSFALVGTGFGYQRERRVAQAQVIARLLPAVRDLRRVGCASIDLCMVASGRLDAYFEKGLHAWDMAAGMLVVAESGAQVVGIDARPPGERMVVAGRSPLLEDLVALLEDLDAGAEPGVTAGR